MAAWTGNFQAFSGLTYVADQSSGETSVLTESRWNDNIDMPQAAPEAFSGLIYVANQSSGSTSVLTEASWNSNLDMPQAAPESGLGLYYSASKFYGFVGDVGSNASSNLDSSETDKLLYETQWFDMSTVIVEGQTKVQYFS